LAWVETKGEVTQNYSELMGGKNCVFFHNLYRKKGGVKVKFFTW